MNEVPVTTLPPERFRDVLAGEGLEVFEEAIERGRELLGSQTIWNVNSTARAGGVAEMLQSLLGYVRGAELDARWLVIEGDEAFFRITKRLHNRLHGAEGDGGPLDDEARSAYERCCEANARALLERVGEGDVVILHDPQTAGMVPHVAEAGVPVIWRAHIGLDLPNDRAREAWAFLREYLGPAAAYVFSREAFVWEGLEEERTRVIPPSIDAFSPKNHAMSFTSITAVLGAAGLAADGDAVADDPEGAEVFLVEPEDLTAFGEAVGALLADPHGAEEMGEAAQIRVRDHFLGPRHLGQYVDLLEDVLRSH